MGQPYSLNGSLDKEEERVYGLSAGGIDCLWKSQLINPIPFQATQAPGSWQIPCGHSGVLVRTQEGRYLISEITQIPS